LILDAVPQSLVAGDTWRWTRTFADYPAGTWAVTYYFENQAKQFSTLATASGTDQAVSIPAATTADYPPGRYRWFARAVAGLISETISGETGWLEVTPNPATAGSRDIRSFARRALDAIEATIEGKATSGQLSFAIRDRTVQSFTLEELMKLRDQMRLEVRSEEARSGSGKGRIIKVRLSR
jgi:hypothetical protein